MTDLCKYFTIRNFVCSLPRCPQRSEDTVRVDIDGHSKEKQRYTNEKPRIIEPGGVVVDVVSEVSTLDIAIDSTR